MKAVTWWAGLSAALIVSTLLCRQWPASAGYIVMGLLSCIHLSLLIRIVRH